MFSLLILASLPLLSAAVCNGDFDRDSAGACNWRCYDGTWVDKSTLSFAEIRDECDQVMDGYRFNRAQCSDLDSLIWPSVYSGCSCPYCGCGADDLAGTPQSWTQLISKQCKNCTCQGNRYSCDTVQSVYHAYNWHYFVCPADGTNWNTYATCTDGRDTYHPGDSYFADVASTEKCTKFCLCEYNGNPWCRTGFQNIVQYTLLHAAFLDKCENELQACTTDAARMFSDDQGPSCYRNSCPKCTCGSNADGTTRVEGNVWWHAYPSHDGFHDTRFDYVDAITCARCTCRMGDNGLTYADCDEDDSYPDARYADASSRYSCPGAAVIACHEDDGSGTCSGAHGTCFPTLKAKSATINSIEHKTNQPDAWCSNSFEIEIASDSDDAMRWNWGNGAYDSVFCGVYGTSGQCFWYDYSISYTDCYGDAQTESRTDYEYCCQGNNCNYIDINLDKSTCTENTQMSSLFHTLYQCMYTGNGRSGWIGGDCDAVEQEIVNCNTVNNLYEDQANCLCKAYKTLYDDAADQVDQDVFIKGDADRTGYQRWIQDQMDVFMTSFTEWNYILNCPGILVCDLTQANPEVYLVERAHRKVYFVSVVFSFMFGLITLIH